MPDFEPMRMGYGALWDRAEVKEQFENTLETVCKRIEAHRKDYEAIEARCKVPWFMIAALHSRESDLNFQTHLHNGDPLSNYTYHVPAGRPKVGHGPPFTFAESAADALSMPAHGFSNVTRWSVERMLYGEENYNGWGYIRLQENSPYVWALTSVQEPGKYVADGVFSRAAWDYQPGCAAIMKTLGERNADVNSRLQDREGKPPPQVVLEQTKRERNVRNAGAATGTAGVGTKAATEAKIEEKPVGLSVIEWTLIGVGVAVFIGGVVMVVRRKQFIWQKWTGAPGPVVPAATGLPPAASPPAAPSDGGPRIGF